MQKLETVITIADAQEAVLEQRERGGDFRLLSQDVIHWCNNHLDSIITSHRLILIEPNYSELVEDQLDEEEDTIDCGLLIQNPRSLRPKEKEVHEMVNRLVRDVIQARNRVWTAMNKKPSFLQQLWAWNPELTDDEWWEMNLQLSSGVHRAAHWKKRTDHVLYDNLLSMEHEQPEGLKRWMSEAHTTLRRTCLNLHRIATGHSLDMRT